MTSPKSPKYGLAMTTDVPPEGRPSIASHPSCQASPRPAMLANRSARHGEFSSACPHAHPPSIGLLRPSRLRLCVTPRLFARSQQSAARSLLLQRLTVPFGQRQLDRVFQGHLLAFGPDARKVVLAQGRSEPRRFPRRRDADPAITTSSPYPRRRGQGGVLLVGTRRAGSPGVPAKLMVPLRIIRAPASRPTTRLSRACASARPRSPSACASKPRVRSASADCPRSPACRARAWLSSSKARECS